MNTRHSVITLLRPCVLSIVLPGFLIALAAAAAGAQETVAHDTSAVAVPAMTAQAADYYESGNILWVFDTLWGILIPALFLFTGLSARIRDLARKLGKRWFFIVGIYIVLFTILTFIVDLPLSYYEEFVRQHAYGLSNQTPGKWAGDSIKSLLVGCIAGFAFLWVPYLLLRKSPQRWWLYLGLLMIPFFFLILLVTPVWVEPLFNDFGPMKDKDLEGRILALAGRAGIDGGRVYEVNKSVDTKKINAYVTGFLGTKRIVLWDTTIEKMSEPELMFVLAHEMGHYVLGHIWKLIFFLSGLLLITLYAAHRAAGWLIGRFRERFGFTELSDVASVPLVILLINVFGLIIVNPAGNWFGRSIEHEADRFGLEITQDNHNAATAFVKLQSENLGNPRPGLLYVIWRADHPVLGDRIDFANTYRPWTRGEPLEYGGYFRR
jgi:STE24 endopeptidase